MSHHYNEKRKYRGQKQNDKQLMWNELGYEIHPHRSTKAKSMDEEQ